MKHRRCGTRMLASKPTFVLATHRNANTTVFKSGRAAFGSVYQSLASAVRWTGEGLRGR